jgi:hypothetical protein
MRDELSDRVGEPESNRQSFLSLRSFGDSAFGSHFPLRPSFADAPCGCDSRASGLCLTARLSCLPRLTINFRISPPESFSPSRIVSPSSVRSNDRFNGTSTVRRILAFTRARNSDSTSPDARHTAAPSSCSESAVRSTRSAPRSITRFLFHGSISRGDGGDSGGRIRCEFTPDAVWNCARVRSVARRPRPSAFSPQRQSIDEPQSTEDYSGASLSFQT